MIFKEVVKFMFYLFCIIILAQVVFITAFFVFLGLELENSYQILFSIIITAIAGMLPAIVFIWSEKVSKKAYFWLTILHITLTASLISIPLNYFPVFDSIKNIYKFLLLLLVIVYGCVHVAIELHSKRMIDELNQRINESNVTHKN